MSEQTGESEDETCTCMMNEIERHEIARNIVMCAMRETLSYIERETIVKWRNKRIHLYRLGNISIRGI